MLMLLHIICAILTKDPWTAERHSVAESLHMRSTQMQKLLEIGRKGVVHLLWRQNEKQQSGKTASKVKAEIERYNKAGDTTDDGAFP